MRRGRILGRCHPDYDVYYVIVGSGMTHIEPARDLRPAAALPVFRSTDQLSGSGQALDLT